MSFAELPPDNFDVLVHNDMDYARLLWLVNRIGEAKLRMSVAKYQARWPGTQPFVSTILKWYRLKVPVEVFAPKPVPVYWLYLLCLRSGPKVKIGLTSQWPHRAFAFLRAPRYFPVRTDLPDLLYPSIRQAALLDLFDGDSSFAYLVGTSRMEAVRRENAAKKQLSSWRTEPPDSVQYSAGGHTEWFDAHIIDQFKRFASSFEDAPVVQTLHAALAVLDAAREPCAPLWARFRLI